MRKFTISARRFSSVVLPFTSPFVRVQYGESKRAGTESAHASRRAGDGGAPITNHDYAAAAVRLSRTYW
jgi:hypothetical protein